MPPRGGRECEGIKGEGECSSEFDFRCFFHLARRFWNHTCNKQHVGDNAQLPKKIMKKLRGAPSQKYSLYLSIAQTAFEQGEHG